MLGVSGNVQVLCFVKKPIALPEHFVHEARNVLCDFGIQRLLIHIFS
jgi:hypothetical protein